MDIYMSLLLFVLIITFVSMAVRRFRYERSNYKKETKASYGEVFSDKGKYGEYLTYKKLEQIKGIHKILTNVYLPTRNGKTTEIDLIYIHKSGIYVLESKNYGGWIFGNENDKNWTQILRNQRKEKFYNPIMQNRGHIRNLLRTISIDESCVKSIIVFSERCALKKVTVYSPDILVVKRNYLVRSLKKLIKNSAEKLDEMQINDMYNNLKRFCNVSDIVKKDHIDNINNKYGS